MHLGHYYNNSMMLAVNLDFMLVALDAVCFSFECNPVWLYFWFLLINKFVYDFDVQNTFTPPNFHSVSSKHYLKPAWGQMFFFFSSHKSMHTQMHSSLYSFFHVLHNFAITPVNGTMLNEHILLHQTCWTQKLVDNTIISIWSKITIYITKKLT